MDKYGFSFSPLGIYRAAFNEHNELYGNWETRMAAHRPSAYEYPDLYNGARSGDRKQQIKRPIQMIKAPPANNMVCNHYVEKSDSRKKAA